MNRFCFSLRTLFVVCTLAALGMWGWTARWAEERKQVRLREHATDLAWAYSFSSGSINGGGSFYHFWMTEGMITPEAARALVAAERIDSITTNATLTEEVRSILASAYRTGVGGAGDFVYLHRAHVQPHSPWRIIRDHGTKPICDLP